MAPKGSFENNYEDYSPEAANILNDSRDGVSTIKSVSTANRRGVGKFVYLYAWRVLLIICMHGHNKR